MDEGQLDNERGGGAVRQITLEVTDTQFTILCGLVTKRGRQLTHEIFMGVPLDNKVTSAEIAAKQEEREDVRMLEVQLGLNTRRLPFEEPGKLMEWREQRMRNKESGPRITPRRGWLIMLYEDTGDYAIQNTRTGKVRVVGGDFARCERLCDANNFRLSDDKWRWVP